MFARLREEQPVAYHSRLDSLPGTPPGRGFWSVTKWADVRPVNRNPRVFSPVDGIRMDDSLDPATNEFFSSIIVMEDPRHAKLRMLVQKGFTQARSLRSKRVSERAPARWWRLLVSVAVSSISSSISPHRFRYR